MQQVLVVLIKQRGTAPPVVVLQRGGLEDLGLAVHPLIDRLARDAEPTSAVEGRAAEVELQDGQGPPVEVDISGIGELAAEALPLPGR